MSNRTVHTVFYAMALVAAASLQWALPPVFGAKLPLLAALAFEAAMTMPMGGALAVAIAAGGAADALSALPGFCSAGYLLIVASAVAFLRGSDRIERRPRRPEPRPLEAAVPFAFVAAVGELWTRAWLVRLDGGAWAAALGAAFTGFFVEYAIFLAAAAIRPRIGLGACAGEGEAP